MRYQYLQLCVVPPCHTYLLLRRLRLALVVIIVRHLRVDVEKEVQRSARQLRNVRHQRARDHVNRARILLPLITASRPTRTHTIEPSHRRPM